MNTSDADLVSEDYLEYIEEQLRCTENISKVLLDVGATKFFRCSTQLIVLFQRISAQLVKDNVELHKLDMQDVLLESINTITKAWCLLIKDTNNKQAKELT